MISELREFYSQNNGEQTYCGDLNSAENKIKKNEEYVNFHKYIMEKYQSLKDEKIKKIMPCLKF